ncbi:mitochondrial carrier domain-containing protein [Suillus spraguei]|nr:mitochondrial carrier domain-containing protein [Suillus spraguei]
MFFKKEKPIHSLIAEDRFVTYPTEFVKTRSQFGGQRESPLTIIRSTLREKGVTGLYSGCSALVIGNSVQGWCSIHMLADAEGNVSAPRSLLAGLGAGMTEAVIAVTPRRLLSMTKMIDDAKRPNPQYRGLAHGTMSIIRQEASWHIPRAFSVMMRQGANSAVRFTTYTTLNSRQLPQVSPLPLVIKTRMQSLSARQQYRNSFHCGYRILTEEGILRFWTGTTPRLARLVMSGGIVFTVYEKIISIIGGLEQK